MQLRNYQIETINLLRKKFSEGKKRIIVHTQVGGGKGLLMAYLTNEINKKNIPVITIMARRDLVFQTVNNYHKYFKILPSIIMGNEPGFKKDALSQVCSIDTLKNRDIEIVKNAKYFIIDEAHDTNANRYQELFSRLNPDAFFIGMTSTPYNNLKFWEDSICPISPKQLRDDGFLVPIVHYAPKSQIVTSEIKVTAGEFNQEQLADASKKITGDIVEHWIKYGQNRPTICFAVNKDHSRLITDSFNASGVSARHLDDQCSKQEREQASIDIKNGSLKIISNIGIFSTGFDLPDLSCEIMARPTMSEILYIQQAGRVLRPHPSKNNAIILDHAGNIYRHGDVYESRPALIGTKKQIDIEKKIRVTTCENCYSIRPMGMQVCPDCGHVNEKQERVIDHIDGELTTIENINTILIKMKTKLNRLIEQEKFMGWKPNAKYFKLHNQFGDELFKYQKELNLPFWLHKFTRNKENA